MSILHFKIQFPWKIRDNYKEPRLHRTIGMIQVPRDSFNFKVCMAYNYCRKEISKKFQDITQTIVYVYALYRKGSNIHI